MLANLSAAEFGWWAAFYALEPFGPRQDEVRAGQVAAAAANAWVGKVAPADFFPSLKSQPATGPAAWSAWAKARCPAIMARQQQQPRRRNPRAAQ